MGRTRVPSDARRRVVQACQPCKASKRRCDGQQPCSRCAKQRRNRRCWYDDNDNDNDNAHGTNTSPARQLRGCAVSRSATCRSGRNSDATAEESQAQGSHVPLTTQRHSPVEVSSSTRMMRGMQGEKVYIGPSATLSFLQLLRNASVRHSGTWYAERDDESDAMLDAEFAHHEESLTDLRDLAELEEHVASFFTSTSGILSVFSKDELGDAVQRLAGAGIKGTHHCPAAVYLAIAIGAQMRSRTDRDARYARAYFRAAQHAMPDVLLVPSLTSTLVALLTAFYMLVASRKNTAYMYLGVAARAAFTLGLHHQASYLTADDHETDRRLRLWKSICVVDLMMCSILGRPPAVDSIESCLQAIPAPPADTDRVPCSEAFEATFNIAKIISDALKKMYASSTVEPQDARHALDRLASWRNWLPNNLQRVIPATGATRSDDSDTNAASVHLACFYYYTAMLVSRPFLISGLQAGALVDEEMQAEVEQLSSTCVDSAIYMSETIHAAAQTSTLFLNASFIKTWNFSAALVLAFSMIVEPQSTFKTQYAFNLVKESFSLQAEVSPSVRQYCRILEDVSDIVRRSHQQAAEKQRQSSQCHLDRLLSSENDPGPLDVPGVADTATLNESDMFLTGWDDPALEQLGSVFDYDVNCFIPGTFAM